MSVLLKARNRSAWYEISCWSNFRARVRLIYGKLIHAKFISQFRLKSGRNPDWFLKNSSKYGWSFQKSVWLRTRFLKLNSLMKFAWMSFQKSVWAHKPKIEISKNVLDEFSRSFWMIWVKIWLTLVINPRHSNFRLLDHIKRTIFRFKSGFKMSKPFKRFFLFNPFQLRPHKETSLLNIYNTI